MPTRHNEEIRKEINRLKREGFKNVKATMPGHEQPSPIGSKGYIPDIEATRPGKRIIEEIKEKQQLPKQSNQIATFRRHAAQKRNTEFILRIYQRGKLGSTKSN